MAAQERRAIFVEVLDRRPAVDEPLEIVERKGRGHPDSICDGVMERISLDLARAYIDRTGQIAHFNVDKALLVAGESLPRFGGGGIARPMRLILGGRASRKLDGVVVPVEEIAERAASEWLRANLRYVEPGRDCRLDLAIGPGSESLGEVYRRGAVTANDTSIGVGYAPLSPTENLVLEAERFLNSPEAKTAHAEAGEDVKVMAIRRGRIVHLTVAIAMVDRFVESEAAYFRRKAEIAESLRQRLTATTSDVEIDGIDVNALDSSGRGESGLYLTVLGTSAESGDDGQVGRGNAANGLIALNRPRGPEAAPGKNPIYHVGKVYSVLAGELAGDVYREVPGLGEVYVSLVSQIGAPIDHPLVASVRVLPRPGARAGDIQEGARAVVDRGLANVAALSERLLRGEIGVY